MSDVESLLREIRDLLKSIDAKLSAPQPRPERKLKLGRKFKNGDSIPPDVDLVMASGGLRWTREYGADDWHPRDVEGPMISTNELLTAYAKYVAEIPAPNDEVEAA